MEHSVKQIFDAFESSRVQLQDQLRSFDPQQLSAFRSDGGWSIIQIMNHLADAEQQSLRYMKRKILQQEPLKKSGFKSIYRLLLLRIAFFLPIKYKVPPVLDEPSNVLTLDETIRKWSAIRDGLRELIGDLDSTQVKVELFKHPLVGKMNIIQALKFMQLHFDRHCSQIQQRLAS